MDFAGVNRDHHGQEQRHCVFFAGMEWCNTSGDSTPPALPRIALPFMAASKPTGHWDLGKFFILLGPI